VADRISAFLADHPAAAPGVACTVAAVPEDSGTADALRAVTHLLTSDTVVVYSGDLITDVPVQALVVSHQVSGALATVLLGQRRTSPTTTTKPGKAPKVSPAPPLPPVFRLAQHLRVWRSVCRSVGAHLHRSPMYPPPTSALPFLFPSPQPLLTHHTPQLWPPPALTHTTHPV
jgi:hypothetical protein